MSAVIKSPRLLEQKRAEHEAWIAHWKASGKTTHLATMPCCRHQVEVAAPPARETWDSLMTCPQCGSLAYKVVTRHSVTIRARCPDGVQ